jgi:hypothetical protein
MANTGQTGPFTEQGKAICAKNLPKDVWDMSPEGRKAKKISDQMVNLKHGLYANVPIRCKGQDCPYADVCHLAKNGNAPYKDPCPIEISTIEDLVKRYMVEFEVEEKDMVDITMIRNLVDLDISLLRCNKKLAKDAEIVQDIIIGLTEEGQPIRQPQINKAYELQSRLLKRRQDTLKLLQGTRKDKAEAGRANNLDPSSVISDMRAQLDKFKQEKENTIDVTNEAEIEEE